MPIGGESYTFYTHSVGLCFYKDHERIPGLGKSRGRGKPCKTPVYFGYPRTSQVTYSPRILDTFLFMNMAHESTKIKYKNFTDFGYLVNIK